MMHHYVLGQVYYLCPFSFLSPFRFCLSHTGVLPQALDTTEVSHFSFSPEELEQDVLNA
jgi:hypothetical protein